MALFELFRYGSQLLLTIILARLLSPSDFGLIAMAMILIGLLDSMSELGIKASLIQKSGSIEEYFDTAWSMQLLRGILLFLIISLTAPLVAKFFKEPMLAIIIPFLGLKPVMVGLTNPASAYFIKNLNFKKQFILQSSGITIRLALVIPLAFLLKNVWVLVIGNLSVSSGRMVTSYFMCSYRPRFKLDRKYAAEMFGFGKWLLGSQIIYSLSRITPNAVIGRLFDAASLGVYRMADQFGMLPAFVIRQLTSKVLFPAYAKIQDDKQRLRINYERVLGVVCSVMLPVTAGGYVLSRPLVLHLLGEKWLGVVDPFRILLVGGCTHFMVQTGYSLFLGMGYPRINFLMRVTSLFVLAVSIFPLFYKFGVAGVAWSVMISFAILLPVWGYMLFRLIGLNFLDLARTLIPSIIGSGVMVLVIENLEFISLNSLPGFLMIVSIGMFVFSGFMYLLWKVFRTGALKELDALL